MGRPAACRHPACQVGPRRARDAEATHKSFCDTEMKRATEDRDATQSEVEDLRARIAATASEVAQLQKEIAELSAGIAANVKACDAAEPGTAQDTGWRVESA